VPTLIVSNIILGLGAGNLWIVVLSYLTCNCPVDIRSLVISGYLTQVTTLNLLGKSCYPLWNSFLLNGLQISGILLRYRITMSVCTFFCLFGLVALMYNKTIKRNPVIVHKHKSLIMLKSMDDIESALTSDIIPSVEPQYTAFAILSIILIIHSISVTVVKVLWPLFLYDNFGWTDGEYAYVISFDSLISIGAIASFPVIEKRIGRFRTATISALLAAFFGIVGFSFHNTKSIIVLHVLMVVLFIGCTAILEPNIKYLTSLYMPQTFQGLTFGVMSTLNGLGNIVGNLAGTFLYANYSGTAFTMICYLLIVGAVMIVFVKQYYQPKQ